MLNEIIQTVKDNAYNIESFGKIKKKTTPNSWKHRLELWFPGAGGMGEMC